MEMPQHFNMADYVLNAGRATPKKVAIEVVGGTPFVMTYSELEQAIRGVASGFLAKDPASGARVLLRLSNTPLFPICYLAAIAVGLVPIPTSPQLTQAEVDKIAAIVTPSITVQSDDVAAPTSSPVWLNEHDITQMQSLPPANFVQGDPHRPAYIVFTSGTGGMPRAVVHAHRAVLARRMMFDGWYGLRSDDRLLHAGAFNWTYTMGTGLIDPWTIGATSLIPAPNIAPAKLGQLLETHRATIFAAAPGVYRKILKAPLAATSSLRHGLSAGEKLPETTRNAWETATGTKIFEAYGMSECSTFISGSPTRPAPPETLGYVQDGRSVKLMDDGVIGIHKSDPGLMLGYFDDPHGTAEKFDGDWFQTGDIGRQTSDGAIRYEGRADDMMNAGGLRVSPVEVENALYLCAPMHEWACAEVRLESDISVIAAFYSGPEVIDEEQVRSALGQHLAAYKVPRLFVAVPALPRGANNKLLRRQLRTEWEAAHGQT